MQALLTSVSAPRWADKEHTAIDCVITTSQLGNELLPFTARIDDVEEHGRALFQQLSNGVFGPVSDYLEIKE